MLFMANVSKSTGMREKERERIASLFVIGLQSSDASALVTVVD